jgi:hypothetical protein
MVGKGGDVFCTTCYKNQMEEENRPSSRCQCYKQFTLITYGCRKISKIRLQCSMYVMLTV